jgi:hypothetical protein
LPGLCIGVATITDADLTSHRPAVIQRLATLAVGDLQVGEATTSQIIDAVDPPLGSFAGLFAEAGAVGNAQDAPVPARGVVFPGRQKLTGEGLETGDRRVQALDQRVFGECRDPSFPCPGGDTLHRVSTGTPGQSQPQKVNPGPHVTRALERLRLSRQGLQIHARWEPSQKSGNDRSAGRYLLHLAVNRTDSSRVKDYLSAYGAEPWPCFLATDAGGILIND